MLRYDNAHRFHHRHYFGVVEPIDFISYEDVEERIISFEDPADVMKLITATRLALFRAVKEAPGSITEIAARLHRDRSAVKRDLDELEHVGLVRSDRSLYEN